MFFGPKRIHLLQEKYRDDMWGENRAPLDGVGCLIVFDLGEVQRRGDDGFCVEAYRW